MYLYLLCFVLFVLCFCIVSFMYIICFVCTSVRTTKQACRRGPTLSHKSRVLYFKMYQEIIRQFKRRKQVRTPQVSFSPLVSMPTSPKIRSLLTDKNFRSKLRMRRILVDISRLESRLYYSWWQENEEDTTNIHLV